MLQRLGPSLQPYKGCTIIDINPGIGLFSAKLHEHLKPKRHILAESSNDFHHLFREDLGLTEGSQHVLRRLRDREAWRLNTYADDGISMEAFAGNAANAPQREVNTSLLLVANLSNCFTRSKRIDTGNYDQHGGLLPEIRLHNFITSCRKQLEFQSAGPVRLLLWLDNVWADGLLPRTVATRTRINLFLETFAQIEEVVGCGDNAEVFSEKRKKRDDLLDLQSGMKVARNMAEAGLFNPRNRQDEMQQRVQQIFEENRSPENLGRQAARRSWHRELEVLSAKFRAGEITQLEGGPANVEILSRGHESRGLTRTSEWKRLSRLRRRRLTQEREARNDRSFLDKKARLDEIDQEIENGCLDATAMREKVTARNELASALNEELDSLQEKIRDRYNLICDDRKAFRLDPPLLAWDQRKAEPLIAHKDEFFGQQNSGSMSLLDIQPRPLSVYPMTEQQYQYHENLRHTLFSVGSSALKSLDFLAPGASAAMLRGVPALTDPRKGGERDLGELRMRTLTPEMMYGIALAWDNWAFKPDEHEMLARISPVKS